MLSICEAPGWIPSTVNNLKIRVNENGNGRGSRLNSLELALLVFNRWNKWAVSRGKRELQVSSSYPTGLADMKAETAQTLIRPQDVKGASHSPQIR